MARIGYLAKGLIYLITGILAFGASTGLGNSSEGKLGVLKFLEKQTFGQILLMILGVGLLCYSFWRLFQSIKDPENIGKDTKGMGKRLGFLFSGIFYSGLGVYAFKQAFQYLGSSDNNSGAGLLTSSGANFIFIAIGIGVAIKSVFQFRKVYKGNFLEKFDLTSIGNLNTRKIVKRLGYAGITARGIVAGIVAYFFIEAGMTVGMNSGDVKGTKEAFSFLRETQGAWLMGIVAMGLICYGCYMFVMAKYRSFSA